jgi:hypothetical protein
MSNTNDIKEHNVRTSFRNNLNKWDNKKLFELILTDEIYTDLIGLIPFAIMKEYSTFRPKLVKIINEEITESLKDRVRKFIQKEVRAGRAMTSNEIIDYMIKKYKIKTKNEFKKIIRIIYDEVINDYWEEEEREYREGRKKERMRNYWEREEKEYRSRRRERLNKLN